MSLLDYKFNVCANESVQEVSLLDYKFNVCANESVQEVSLLDYKFNVWHKLCTALYHKQSLDSSVKHLSKIYKCLNIWHT